MSHAAVGLSWPGVSPIVYSGGVFGALDPELPGFAITAHLSQTGSMSDHKCEI